VTERAPKRGAVHFQGSRRRNDFTQRFRFSTKELNPLLFELREEDRVDNAVTKYGSKEIKLAFCDGDEFKALAE
jgi:hypothetical protein